MNAERSLRFRLLDRHRHRRRRPPRLRAVLQPALFSRQPGSRSSPLWDGGMSFHGGMARADDRHGRLHARTRAATSCPGSTCSAPSRPSACSSAASPTSSMPSSTARHHHALGRHLPRRRRLPRHPSQLYEGLLEGVLLFLRHPLLHPRRASRCASPGWSPASSASAMRCRASSSSSSACPTAHIGYLACGWLTMGMVLSLPILIAGIALVVWAQSRRTWLSPTFARRSDRHADPHQPDRCRSRPNGPLPHPSLHGLLPQGRPARRAGRLHHRARDQPDVRRADRRLDRRSLAQMGQPPRFTLLELGPGRGT